MRFRAVLSSFALVVAILPVLAEPARAAGLSNDGVAGAAAVEAFPFRVTQQTAGATTESGEDLSCHSMGATVWYVFETPAIGIIEIDAITAGVRNPDGSVSGEFKPALALYRGERPGSLTRLGCQTGGNATNIGGSNQPAGRYWVQAGGVDGATGRLDLEIDITTTARNSSRSGAVLGSSGCNRNVLNRNDDGSTGRVALPFPLDFYGRTYDSLYVNNNGNITFDAPLSTFTPFGLTRTNRAIIAPFFADVDTRGSGSDTVKYGFGEVAFQGRQAFCVNWVNVGYYAGHFDKTNSFQLLLVDRSDRRPGSFDIVFNYDRVLWETGDASGGRGGLGGSPARAGFSNGAGDAFSSYELVGSGVVGGLLDNNETSGLVHGSIGSDTLGRYVFTVDTGSPTCANDDDCDGLNNRTEQKLGTSATNADTDGDGLPDGAEVGVDETAEAGYLTPQGRSFTTFDLFGPFGPNRRQDCDDRLDANLRPVGQYTCLNPRPDPRRKDVFVEIDMQDCNFGGCPDDLPVVGRPLPLDPLHHSPNIAGLEEAVDMFARAPVTNPDGSRGVRLHILVDEALEHTPNCDQLPSVQRSSHYGTVGQRGDAALLAARSRTVRYLWSGHSTRRDGGCANPSPPSFALQGFGGRDLADYDNTPFGQVAIGGDTILMSLSPLWNCPSTIEFDSPVPNLGELGSCFRESEGNLVRAVGLSPLATQDPGIFPAEVEDMERRWPISLLLGEFEAEAGRQLWSRALSHTLGHALGLGDDEVHNDPAPAGRHQVNRTTKLSPLAPDSYSRWSGLKWAPDGPGGAVMTEQRPPYDLLAATSRDLSDPDNDGVLEGRDNCPGTWNPGQSNSDNGRFGLGHNDAEFGDACDPDIDGDGIRNSAPGEGEQAVGGRLAGTSAAAGPTGDPYPYDTDNDGVDNDADADDDGDGLEEAVDNCRLDSNPRQDDRDSDQLGDACDLDADGDGIHNDVEVAVGSLPLDPQSRPEYVGRDGVCGNGADDDGDGLRDSADRGCQDGDGDGFSDVDDRCPGLASGVNRDTDGDGRGDACDVSVRITGATTRVVSATTPDPVVSFRGSVAGTYSVVDGEDCAGPVRAGGDHSPSSSAVSTSVQLPRAALTSGYVTVCLSALGETAVSTVPLRVDVDPPVASAPRLLPATDTGISATDGVTAAEQLTFTGITEAGADVHVVEDGALIARASAGSDGTWTATGTGSEGPHTYQVVVFDAAGNRSSPSDGLPLLIDRTPPAVSVSSDAPPDGTLTGRVSIAFSGGDAGTSASCALDGGAPFSCVSPVLVSAPKAGQHTVSVRVEDRAGNHGSGSTTFRTVYAFTGFERLAAPPTVHLFTAGSSHILRFGLGGDRGPDIFDDAQPSSRRADCDTWAVLGSAEPADEPGNRDLTYSRGNDRYQYVWKSHHDYRGTCRLLTLGLNDESQHGLRVRFR